jgi:putative ABC transport system permease protein
MSGVKRWFSLLKQSLLAVMAFKMRSVFCLVSVVLGIASMVVIVAATEGAYQKAFEIVERFGPASLLVISGGEQASAVRQRRKTLTLADADAVRDAFPNAYLVMPMSSVGNVTISHRERKHQARIVGSGSHYSLGWSWPVVEGSDISELDVKGLRNVGLIGQEIVRRLFGDQDPVGKYLMVRRIPVQVIGVLQARGTSHGGNLDEQIVMPITTVMRKLLYEKQYVSAFRVRFTSEKNIKQQADALKVFLRQRHRLQEGEPDDFRMISATEIIQFLVALSGSLVLFLGISGVTSLIVAGFVLANLFLLSVRERAREIGIRRAVGACRSDILFQFLAEAVLLTTVGGVLGFVAGLGASRLLTLIAEFPMVFSWKAFVIGLVLAWGVGIVFGLQPAWRAARLNPIEAIR